MRSPTKKNQPLPPLKVRQEPPTLEEAIIAARCLADDDEQIAEIAAGLMGVSVQEAMAKIAASSKRTVMSAATTAPAPRGAGTFVVERRRSIVKPAGGPARPPLKRP
ncbi:hypothetical protein [Alsobacter sp. R-9]